MKRLPDWRARLARALNVIVDPRREFTWGDHDCFMGLVVPAVLAMTGQDIGAAFRGRYETVAGAKAVMAQAGFADLAQAAANYFPEIPVAQAHVGDIAILESHGEGLGVGLGIVIGERIMVLSGRGSATVSMKRAVKAFRV